jgi:hypothetical protein
MFLGLPDPYLDPLARDGTFLRIRIRTNMSRIRNTAFLVDRIEQGPVPIKYHQFDPVSCPGRTGQQGAQVCG